MLRGMLGHTYPDEALSRVLDTTQFKGTYWSIFLRYIERKGGSTVF